MLAVMGVPVSGCAPTVRGRLQQRQRGVEMLGAGDGHVLGDRRARRLGPILISALGPVLAALDVGAEAARAQR